MKRHGGAYGGPRPAACNANQPRPHSPCRLDKLGRLKELKLYDNCVASLAGLQGLTALHTLDLSSNCISQIAGLQGLRGLRVLKLSYNQLTSLEGLGRTTTGLESLDVSGNAIKDLAGATPCPPPPLD